jgi:hypothetical protein
MLDLLAWPVGLGPQEAPVYQRNELVIAAPPARVFAWLTRADLWSTYYGNAKAVQPQETPLRQDTRFHWWTFGVPLDTQVQTFEQDRGLGWLATMPGLTAYHKWILEPVPEGTRVVTEETDGGWIAWLGQGMIRDGLKREHQHWLEGLAKMAEGGPPPAP